MVDYKGLNTYTECQEKDDLITSEGIETSQGVRLKRTPLKSMQDGVEILPPHRHDGYEWRNAMSSGFGYCVRIGAWWESQAHWLESYGVGWNGPIIIGNETKGVTWNHSLAKMHLNDQKGFFEVRRRMVYNCYYQTVPMPLTSWYQCNDGVTSNNPIGIRPRERMVQTLPNENISRGWVETTPFELVAEGLHDRVAG